jgi:hypothetical protein
MQPRLSLVTLGVRDLSRAIAFYRDGLGLPTDTQFEGVAFIQMGSVKLSLYPLDELAKDAQMQAQNAPSQPFPGFSLAHNVRTREEVEPVIEAAVKAGGRLVKAAEDAFWGGYSGYFSDLDGFLWEVAWNPHFPIIEE